MGTGIVAIAVRLDGRETLSSALLAIAAAVWVVLAARLLAGLAGERTWPLGRARELDALTAVAGTSVLGVGLAALGRPGPALGLWAIGLAFWCAILPGVVGRLPPAPGGRAFLLTVSTQSLAVLGATLAAPEEAPWMAWVALVLLVVGLVLYPVGLSRFPRSELRGGGGEIWIAGGALGISALACAQLIQAGDALHALHGLRGALVALDLALWIAAIAWLPLLVAAELRWPRPGYRPSRWATVFPVGMYAACSFVTARALGAGGIADFARIWTWIALAVWCLAAIGLARRATSA